MININSFSLTWDCANHRCSREQGAVDKVYSWAELYAEDPEMAAIAHGMTLDYGYDVNTTRKSSPVQSSRIKRAK